MAAPVLKTYFQTVKTNAAGNIFLTGILNVSEFNKVNVEIIQWPQVPVSMTVTCSMGKLSGSTLGQELKKFALTTTGTIQTFDVVGPEFNLVLTGGAPNTDVPIQAWVFLH